MSLIPNSLQRLFRPMNYYRFFLWRTKILQISFHSRIARRKINSSGQRGLFLDCGSNVGQGFEFFRRYYPNNLYDYILFEPNPYCFRVLNDKYSGLESEGVHLKNVAVGVENTEVDFYGLEDEKGGLYSVGGSTLQEHNSKIHEKSNHASLRVPSIHFPDFLVDVLQRNDYSYVILKLDIEGGEYLVLESLVKANLISRFETIYVEFHSQYMNEKFRKIYSAKEKKFMQAAKDIETRVVKWI
jgi:FkbM family methyltransferase